MFVVSAVWVSTCVLFVDKANNAYTFACNVKGFLLFCLTVNAHYSALPILLVQMESHTKFLRSSMDMRESMHKASLQLQDKVDSLHEYDSHHLCKFVFVCRLNIKW